MTAAGPTSTPLTSPRPVIPRPVTPHPVAPAAPVTAPVRIPAAGPTLLPTPLPDMPPSAFAATLDEAYLAFWREYHLCTLTTLRPNGTPHVVPVGATFDPETGIARVITGRDSRKARNIRAAGPSGMRVALCQIDGRRWATLEGTAVLRDDPASIADAERRYAARYRPPSANPLRVVIEIRVDRTMGRG
ncbi:pyridoxamine 5'-phosphate oxidase family protein [Streptodolium elevatio]|uniref:TIGR03618 family F420-dependent PPOX class oxidoreductase n=1 Tax=Streptodolium elevatio TaxID=3157996 RepID=A0ABV3DF31_9ACTN